MSQHNRWVDNYIGVTRGDFTAIDFDIPKGKVTIKCQKCGNIKHVLKGYFVSRGVSHKQCGKDLKMNHTQFYRIWANLRTRTCNPNYEKWDRYGGRGITSDCWEYFADFYKDMYISYTEHLEVYGEGNTTIDRIDSDGNYEVTNCRWATWDEQADNKKRNLTLQVEKDSCIEVIRNLKKYTESKGLPYRRVYSKYNRECNMKSCKGFTYEGYTFKLLEECND